MAEDSNSGAPTIHMCVEVPPLCELDVRPSMDHDNTT